MTSLRSLRRKVRKSTPTYNNQYERRVFRFTDWGTDRLQKNDKQTQDTMWQDNWDDEEIDDDFCKQLRAQLQSK